MITASTIAYRWFFWIIRPKYMLFARNRDMFFCCNSWLRNCCRCPRVSPRSSRFPTIYRTFTNDFTDGIGTNFFFNRFREPWYEWLSSGKSRNVYHNTVARVHKQGGRGPEGELEVVTSPEMCGEFYALIHDCAKLPVPPADFYVPNLPQKISAGYATRHIFPYIRIFFNKPIGTYSTRYIFILTCY